MLGARAVPRRGLYIALFILFIQTFMKKQSESFSAWVGVAAWAVLLMLLVVAIAVLTGCAGLQYNHGLMSRTNPYSKTLNQKPCNYVSANRH